MRPVRPVPIDVAGELTLLELVLLVQEYTANDGETVEVVSYLLERGGIRIRAPRTRPGRVSGSKGKAKKIPPRPPAFDVHLR